MPPGKPFRGQCASGIVPKRTSPDATAEVSFLKCSAKGSGQVAAGKKRTEALGRTAEAAVVEEDPGVLVLPVEAVLAAVERRRRSRGRKGEKKQVSATQVGEGQRAS